MDEKDEGKKLVSNSAKKEDGKIKKYISE